MNIVLGLLLSIGKAAWVIALTLVALIVCLVTLGVHATGNLVGFLFQAWIIQGIFGAWVVHNFQERSAVIARTNQSLEAKYQRQTEAIRSLYSLIEQRLYASRRYLDVLETEPAMLAEERAHYRDVVRTWNQESRIAQVTLLVEFRDSEYGLILDREYFPEFATIDGLLRSQRKLVERSRPTDAAAARDIRSRLARLNRISIDLIREAMKDIQKTRNHIDRKIPITLENAPHLSHWRLVQSLFQQFP